MSNEILLSGATVTQKRQFLSKTFKPCFVVELAFHGGSYSKFLEAQEFAALTTVEEGKDYDVVCSVKTLAGNKFELQGALEFYPADSCVIKTPEAVPVAKPAVARAG